jgi:hypothetical protein
MGQPYSGPERPATAGTVNTGSGGGGGGSYQNFSDAAAGGSGIVIVRYSDTYQLEVGSGLTHSTVNVNGFNITSFTAGTGNVMFTPIQTSPYAYELLETVTLGGSQASVTFSNLNATYGSEYQHLQLRIVGKTDRDATNDNVIMRFNGDGGANYSFHHLRGSSGSVSSGAGANETKIVSRAIGGNNGNFGAVVIDILDAFETNKHKTTRSLGGYATDIVELGSGSWRNTAALTSILLDQDVGSNFLTGSRFSLYGIKAS